MLAKVRELYPSTSDERGGRRMTRIVDSDLVGVIDRGEDATLEFKRPLTKDIGRSCARALTAGGGTVLVGVSDAGRVVGVGDHTG